MNSFEAYVSDQTDKMLEQLNDIDAKMRKIMAQNLRLKDALGGLIDTTEPHRGGCECDLCDAYHFAKKVMDEC